MERSLCGEVCIKFRREVEGAMAPTRATSNSAGLDLYSAESVVIAHAAREWVSTGISLWMPLGKGLYGQVMARSGLAGKGIDTGAGLIDADYRGTVRVLLINRSGAEYKVERGARIAQLLIGSCWMGTPTETKESLETTERGLNGFGSSGV